MSKYYELAQSYRGTKEWPGKHRDNPVVMQFYRDVDHHEVQHDETAWCAAFVGAMLERCDIKSTRNLTARSYLNWGKKISKPKIGDIVVFWRESPSSWKGHVGFFAGYTSGGKVLTLGGNQNNKVSVKAYSANSVLGFRRVKVIKEPFKPMPPQGVEVADEQTNKTPPAQSIKESWTLKGGIGALASLLVAISQLNPIAQASILLAVAFIGLMMWRRIDAAIQGKIG